MEQHKINRLADDLEPLFEEVEESIHQPVRRAERDAIRADYVNRQYTNLQSKLINYITKHSAAGYLHEQFYLYYEIKLAQWQGEEAGHIRSLAHRALELTKPIDVIPDCKSKKYTYVEMEWLLILIECRHEQWSDSEKREICLLKIIQYARLYFETERCENIEDRAWQILLAGADTSTVG